MRRVQVSISIVRFGEKDPNGKYQHITVYADAENSFEALTAAYYEALTVLQADTPLPSFGVRMNQVEENRSGLF